MKESMCQILATKRPVSWGFSLVELLVCIAIVALLVSLLLPALQSARRAAKTSVCLSNKRQVSFGMMTYGNDWQYIIPTGRSSIPGQGTRWWYEFLIPDSVNPADYLAADHKAVDCPEGQEEDSVFGGYHSQSRNSSDDRDFVVYDSSWAGGGQFMGVSIPKMRWTSKIALLTCTARWDRGLSTFSHGYPTFQHFIQGPGGGWKGTWAPHNGGATTAIFADGHAESLGPEAMRSLRNAHVNAANSGMYSWFDAAGEWVEP